MPKASLFLALIAMLLGAARLFTGIVYSNDSESSYYVLKPAPALFIEETETAEAPIGAFTVVFDDELALPFEDENILLMRITPGAVPVLLIGAAWVLRRYQRHDRKA